MTCQCTDVFSFHSLFTQALCYDYNNYLKFNPMRTLGLLPVQNNPVVNIECYGLLFNPYRLRIITCHRSLLVCVKSWQT